MINEEEFVPITPVNFFQISADCHYLKDFSKNKFSSIDAKNYRDFLLPDTSTLCGEFKFADVAMGWHEEGIEFFVKVDKPFQRTSYPELQRGDSFEAFIDTRDVKTSGFNTRFCHHFFFLPESIDDQIAGEMTRFRTEDAHPLCNPDDLKVKSTIKAGNYFLNIFIPNHCLQGYDPDQFGRLGFTYRLNRPDGFSQHYSVVSDDYQLEQQPSLWSSLRLIR